MNNTIDRQDPRGLGKRRWWVLIALSFGLLAVGLDLTVLNVALPTLATALHASTSQLQWFVDAYNLVLAAVLLPAGMLGDRFGRKKLLLMALVLFGASSVFCAVSNSSGMLITARVFLGIGAAFLMPLSMSVLPVLFSGAERTKAMMIWASANMIGIPLGPIVGGWLLDHYAWGSVFLLNIPFVLIALSAVSWLLPESKSEKKIRLDWFGVFTSSLGLVSLTYGVIRAGEKTWGNTGVWAALAIGLISLAVFVIWERRTSTPLIDLSLFKAKGFTWGSILATIVSFAMFGLLFTMPQYFQSVEGANTLGTGIRLLPMIGGLLIGAQLSNKIIGKISAKLNAAIGFAFLAGSLFMGAATGMGDGYGYAAIWIAITGMGIGFALPTAMDGALGALSAERSGVGSALIMALRQLGGSFGVAILGAVLNAVYRNHVDVSKLPDAIGNTVQQGVSAGAAVAQKMQSPQLLQSVKVAFLHGMDALLWVSGGLAVLGILLTLLFLPARNSSSEAKAEKAG